MSITIDGLDKLVSDLRKFGKEGETIVKRELGDTSTKISLKATQRAPGPPNFNTNQRIEAKPSNAGLTWSVGVQGTTDIDAYLEFGTGLDANQLLNKPEYTDEIRALALTFFKTGDGTLRNQAYLFPSFFEESPKLIEKLKRELESLANKT